MQVDLALLRERYEVREWYQKSRIVNLFALSSAIRASDLVFGWFASWHTFFPVLLAKRLERPSILVVGGYDTANLPDIGYGSMRGGFKKWIAGTTMRQATALIVNSHYVENELAANVGRNLPPVTVIHHGLNGRCRQAGVDKENLVVTIGNVTRENLQRKGLEPFVRAAALMPDTPFVLIGAWRDNAIDFLKGIATPNVTFTGWVSAETLDNYLDRARVYVQASRHEGFGLAVAEAILHECIPVVTRAGALPEVAGDAGVYVDSTAPIALVQGIRRGFDLELSRNVRTSARIIHEFPLEGRRHKIVELIEQTLRPAA